MDKRQDNIFDYCMHYVHFQTHISKLNKICIKNNKLKGLKDAKEDRLDICDSRVTFATENKLLF